MSALIEREVPWIPEEVRVGINHLATSLLSHHPYDGLTKKRLLELPQFSVLPPEQAVVWLDTVTNWGRFLGCLVRTNHQKGLKARILVSKWGSLDDESPYEKPWDCPFPRDVEMLNEAPSPEVPEWITKAYGVCSTQYAHAAARKTSLRSIFYGIRLGEIPKPAFRDGAYLVWPRRLAPKRERKTIVMGPSRPQPATPQSSWLEVQVKELYQDCLTNKASISERTAVLDLASRILKGGSSEVQT